MNITNVVLDRDKGFVTFDTANQEGMELHALWVTELDRWVVDEITSYEAVLNECLSFYSHGPAPDQEPTPSYYHKTYKGIKFDPYRVCKIYDMRGGPREHIVKKLLRGVNKDDGINTELDLINVVEGQLKRWREMIQEDAE